MQEKIRQRQFSWFIFLCLHLALLFWDCSLFFCVYFSCYCFELLVSMTVFVTFWVYFLFYFEGFFLVCLTLLCNSSFCSVPSTPSIVCSALIGFTCVLLAFPYLVCVHASIPSVSCLCVYGPHLYFWIPEFWLYPFGLVCCGLTFWF